MRLRLTNDYGNIHRSTALRLLSLERGDHPHIDHGRSALLRNKILADIAGELRADSIYALICTPSEYETWVPALWLTDIDNPSAWNMIVAAEWRRRGGSTGREQDAINRATDHARRFLDERKRDSQS